MKNWEKYEKELKEFNISNFAVVDGKPTTCGGTSCRDCDFKPEKNGTKTCNESLANWLYEEDVIRVGDVVYPSSNDLEILVYVTHTNGNSFSGIGISSFNLGMPYVNRNNKKWTKTGKHISLGKVIEFIGGTN